MLNRRSFVGTGFAALAGRMLPEAAYAQRALVRGNLPPDMVWLNANENPDGPPQSSIEAMTKVLTEGGRYHYQEFGAFTAALAQNEDLAPEQIQVGSGSSEVLHAAVDAFTSPTRPLITVSPTYEGPVELAARGLGRTVVRIPLEPPYAPDVKKLASEAEKAGGGLIYLCNPNNPTSSITPKKDQSWLIENLPANTVLLIDEAYAHFADNPDYESALGYVRRGQKNVVVTRTFSKIYGMAGLRAGFACATPDLIEKMAPFRNNVISIVTARAVLAAVGESRTLIPERRAKFIRIRRELCDWLRERGLPYIDPNGNFIMIDVGRDAREFISAMPPKGVAVGRPFPPMNNFLRVSIGTDADMAKFRDVFWSVYKA
ncbi:MAG TPA: aminotransferase class I/II-fold pyridoxal phosphate-dependent enzyme [Bryobacteraceae bacterium]|nr:aminotransferase class I/II-fold pyridoxal phosphate-dependent enzyme [Bryobacteraceae bacterium]